MQWDGEVVFLWSEERLVIALREGVHNLYEVVTAVEMIVVMEVSI